MQFPRYVRVIDPIGNDLRFMLSYANSWYVLQDTPYVGYNLYPPLATVLFVPLLGLPFYLSFKIISVLSLVLLILTIVKIPNTLGKGLSGNVVQLLFLTTALFSYGFHFELERGQFNVIAVSLCIIAIWLFHYKSKYRVAAYLLFTLSVQLKVYPLICIILLVHDWKAYKTNVQRILALSAVNFTLLFILGPGVFGHFIRAIQSQIMSPYVWVGNHSIHSFVAMAAQTSLERGYFWPFGYEKWIQIGLMIIVALCFIAIVWQVIRQNKKGIDPYLLAASLLVALTIPSVSHDYTLPILASPMAFLFYRECIAEARGFSSNLQNLLYRALLFLLSFFYFSTLFSFTNKPALLKNNCPALIIMLIVITGLSILKNTPARELRPVK